MRDIALAHPIEVLRGIVDDHARLETLFCAYEQAPDRGETRLVAELLDELARYLMVSSRQLYPLVDEHLGPQAKASIVGWHEQMGRCLAAVAERVAPGVDCGEQMGDLIGHCRELMGVVEREIMPVLRQAVDVDSRSRELAPQRLGASGRGASVPGPVPADAPF